MRESRTYGSVRGARGNSRPYRDRSVIRGNTLEMEIIADIVPDFASLHPGYDAMTRIRLNTS
jgi:hypothetical protein